MKTNYEKIKTIIESGKYALCEDNNGNYYIFSSIMRDGGIRSTGYESTIEDCLDYIGVCRVYKGGLNDMNFKSIKPYSTKPTPYKVGDMVDILEVARDIGDCSCFESKKRDMTGKGPFEIKNVYDYSFGIYYKIWTKDKEDYFLFPHYAVCLHIEDEQEETITIGETTYSKKEFEEATRDLKPIIK